MEVGRTVRALLKPSEAEIVVVWTTALKTEEVRSSQLLHTLCKSLKNVLLGWTQCRDKDGNKVSGR